MDRKSHVKLSFISHSDQASKHGNIIKTPLVRKPLTSNDLHWGHADCVIHFFVMHGAGMQCMGSAELCQCRFLA